VGIRLWNGSSRLYCALFSAHLKRNWTLCSCSISEREWPVSAFGSTVSFFVMWEPSSTLGWVMIDHSFVSFSFFVRDPFISFYCKGPDSSPPTTPPFTFHMGPRWDQPRSDAPASRMRFTKTGGSGEIQHHFRWKRRHCLGFNPKISGAKTIREGTA
jgi:hypothetical protein